MKKRGKSKVSRIPEPLKNFIDSIKGKHSSQEIIELLFKEYQSENEIKKRINKSAISSAIDELISWNPKKREIYDLSRSMFVALEDENYQLVLNMLNDFSHLVLKLQDESERAKKPKTNGGIPVFNNCPGCGEPCGSAGAFSRHIAKCPDYFASPKGKGLYVDLREKDFVEGQEVE